MSTVIEKAMDVNKKADEISEALGCTKDHALTLLGLVIQARQLAEIKDLYKSIEDMSETIDSIELEIQ